MRRWLVQLLVLPFLFNVSAPAYAATTTVTLAWDANTEPDLAGYKLYEAATCTGTFVLKQTIGLVATTTVSGLIDGSYCWQLTAFDTAGNESGPSNQVPYSAETVPPGVPGGLAIFSVERVP